VCILHIAVFVVWLYDDDDDDDADFMLILSGLLEVVHPDMLSIFCGPELQVLISGANTTIDVEDLRRSVQYVGGFTGLDPSIVRFWSVVTEMSAEDRALLVKFVTACERPPMLGFSNLSPPFTIQRVSVSDDLRLPTASTCFNVLKLPTYSSKQVMQQKLLTAIRSKSGFDLS
jgi:ubiquitin-protein ligase E3 C